MKLTISNSAAATSLIVKEKKKKNLRKLFKYKHKSGAKKQRERKEDELDGTKLS